MMGHSDTLMAKLQESFHPEALEVVNESHLHAGHQEKFDGSGETHLRIRIVSDAFAGMSRLERHRAVNRIAEEAFGSGLHALAIEARTPTEAGR